MKTSGGGACGAARRQAEGRKEGRKKGVKGARYDFVRGPRRREGRGEEGFVHFEEWEKNERARSKPHTFGPRTRGRGSPRSQWQLGRTDGQTDR